MASDLRETLRELERLGFLQKIEKQVDASWEISAVSRRVFTLPTHKRPVLLFEHVQGYDMPVLVGLYGNRRVYAGILGVAPDEVNACWANAINHPLPPRPVESAPCQEVVWLGEEADTGSLPVPVWVPGLDAAPYITAGNIITRDPETGNYNSGTYRVQVKGPRRLGVSVGMAQHIGLHWRKYNEANRPMEVAVVLGPDPVLPMASVAKLPFGADELAVAGALRGEALSVIKCKTIDLYVPAKSEIVIEGVVPPNYKEPEGPFGEFTGFIGEQNLNPVIEITAITHRKNPIFHALLSQKPPSESSLMRAISLEAAILRDLHALGLPGIRDVHVTEASGGWFHTIVSIKKLYPGHPREVMTAVWGAKGQYAKHLVIVDEEIDVHDLFDVEWAIGTCVQASRDIVIIKDHIGQRLDPSIAERQEERNTYTSDKLGIDATKKWPYPPVALPPQEHLQRVEEQWPAYGIREV